MIKKFNMTAQNTDKVRPERRKSFGWLPPNNRTTPIQKYILAVLFVAAATELKWLLEPFGFQQVFVLNYSAVILAALIGGLGPGLLAIALSTAAVTYFFLEPRGSFAIVHFPDAFGLVMFYLNAVFITLIAHRLKRVTEKARQESEEKLSLAQQAAEIGTFQWDIQNDVVRLGPRLEAMCGLSPGSFAGTGEALAALTHPEDRLEMVHRVERSVKTFQPEQGEWRIVRPDGSVHWLVGSWQVFKDAHGQPGHLTGVAIDITERRRMEDELRRSRDELELRVRERTAELQEAYDRLVQETSEREKLEGHLRQADKMEAVGTLAGGVAHDFNNMLAVIIGNAELAIDDVHGRARKNIKQIIDASKRATDLVRQILAFSRKTEHVKNVFSLSPLIKETYKLLRSSIPTTIEMNLHLQTTADTIIGDPSQIQQVLMNLATNANYAMKDNGGKLLIGLSDVAFAPGQNMPDDDMQPGNYVKLTVKDTGTGIKKDVKERMFEPFFTTKERGQGTGMGLAMVYGIVKSHGGAITVESREGEGSTFDIFLPCCATRLKEEDERQTAVPGGNEKILLIDDEPAVVEMAADTLKRLGYEVSSEISAARALTSFLNEPNRFDLVITDQVMPGLTGTDLAQKMLEVRKDLPIILITGYSETVSPESAKAVGITEFVMKPITRREVAGTVRRLLDGRNQGR